MISTGYKENRCLTGKGCGTGKVLPSLPTMPLTHLLRTMLVSLAVLCSLVLVACTPPGPGGGYAPVQAVENAEKKGRLSLFLNLLESEGPALAMQITAIDLLAEDGGWLHAYSGSIVVQSEQIKSGQQFLVRMALPPDTYTRIRLTLAETEEIGDGKGRAAPPLKSPELVLELRDSLTVAEGDSKSLFFTWDTRASVRDNMLVPVLIVAPTLKKLIADVAYVACPEINTVFLVSTEKNRVIDSLGIPGNPVYLLQSRNFGHNKVYALTGSALIGFSTSANEIVEKNNLSMVRKAVHMAFSPDGRWGYIIDQQRGSVLRMDMGSGTIDGQARLNYAPNYIIYHGEANLLAVSVGIGQQVVILDPETLRTIDTISTGVNPDGLMSRDGRLLYIAETGSNSVMVYDFAGNGMVIRIGVGFQPRRIAGSESFVYVANSGSRSISVLQPGLMGVSRTIPFPTGPLEMAYASRHKWLYVGSEQDGALAVIDPITNEITGRIELGAKPGGILVID